MKKIEISTGNLLQNIIEDNSIFEPIVNVNGESGKFMSFEYIEDSYDGIFSRVSDYTRLANRIDQYGISEFLTWLSSTKSKKLIIDNGNYKVIRKNKYDTKAIIKFNNPINVIIGCVNEQPIIEKVNRIKGEFTYQWFWFKNGRQNKVANAFEVYYNCQEYYLDK